MKSYHKCWTFEQIGAIYKEIEQLYFTVTKRMNALPAFIIIEYKRVPMGTQHWNNIESSLMQCLSIAATLGPGLGITCMVCSDNTVISSIETKQFMDLGLLH